MMGGPSCHVYEDVPPNRVYFLTTNSRTGYQFWPWLFISAIILGNRFDLLMNFKANFKIGSIFSDHLIPGLDRILMSWVTKSLQNLQECHPSETPRQYKTHRLCRLGCLSLIYVQCHWNITRKSPQMEAAVSHIYVS